MPQADLHPSHCVGIIPARWAASRFPGKPLKEIAGVSLIQRVYTQAKQASELDEVFVATDDERIAAHVKTFGGQVVMTAEHHQSGTDRIAEAVKKIGTKTSCVLNIQGDEPLIDPLLIDSLAHSLKTNPHLQMVTAASPFKSLEDFQNPNRVKVVCSKDGIALYFSRSPIPYQSQTLTTLSHCLRHQGIYGFRRQCLEQFVQWERSPLEKLESLEQLRALENGVQIKVVITEHEAQGVDVPDDVFRVEALLGTIQQLQAA